DNIIADVRSGQHMMGDVFTTASLPGLRVKLVGTAKFAKVHIIRDNAYVYSTQPGTSQVQFSWVDNAAAAGKTSYYYVRGEQEDGQIVWASPMWITYSPKRNPWMRTAKNGFAITPSPPSSACPAAELAGNFPDHLWPGHRHPGHAARGI